MIPRSEVYRVIDGEREYQNSLTSDRTDGCIKSVGDYILMMEHYIQAARTEWCSEAGNVEALRNIRKVAGIAVRCMQEHGVVQQHAQRMRDIWDVIDNVAINKETTSVKIRQLPGDYLDRIVRNLVLQGYEVAFEDDLYVISWS